jgi:hypothetical protein
MSETTSDPSLKPERLPSWVKNLPAVTSEVPVPVPPWHAQAIQVVKPLVIQHRVMLSVGGGLMVVLTLLLSIGSSKKPAQAQAPAPVAAPVAAEPAPAAALAVAAVKPEEHRAATAVKAKKAATPATRTAKAKPVPTPKAAPKDRRPARPATGRG